jgi:hypothetical protein
VNRMLKDFVIPAFETGRGKKLERSAKTATELAAVLEALQKEPLRHPRNPETRMLPSPRKKDQRRPAFHPKQ